MPKNTFLLSKSTYIRSLKCEKSLFLYKFYYKHRSLPDNKTLELFRQGHSVEEQFRREYFPNGINVKPNHPKSWFKSVDATNKLLHNGQPIIYEAAFQYQQVMCAVDVIVQHLDKSISIYEIKRSSSPKPSQFEDLALQYWVIHHSGYTIRDAFLVNFIGELEESQSNFLLTNYTENCNLHLPIVNERVKNAKLIINKEEMPTIQMGNQCSEPYKCDFIKFCTKHQAEEC